MVDHKDIELAQVKVIKTALRKDRKYDNLAKIYGDYLKKLRAEKNPNNYIKTLAVKMFPKEEAYTERLENYRKKYENNDIYSSLEEESEFLGFIKKDICGGFAPKEYNRPFGFGMKQFINKILYYDDETLYFVEDNPT
ncbi:hypothetical protein C1646_756821 [Rhizophagus diaphanus]|nr:hypothetical protein C1646_756821 [Rhizophagus diaphanus] [Rhizophagus sp. MUCL 43196]